MKNKKVLIIIGILLVCGFFAYRYINRTSYSNISTLTPKMTKNAEVIIQKDSPKEDTVSIIDISNEAVAGWDMYENKEFKFGIKYPNDFIVKEHFYQDRPLSKGCNLVEVNNRERTQKGLELRRNKNIEDTVLGFRIYINPSLECEESFLKRNSEISGGELSSQYLNSEEIEIASNTFTKKTYLGHHTEPEYETSDYSPYKFSIWQINIDKTTYVYTYQHRKGDENIKAENEFKKILSTFKIIK